MIEQSPPATRYPLLALAACFAAGIALGRYGPAVHWPGAWFLTLPLLILLNRRTSGTSSRLRELFLFSLLFVLAGLLRYTSLPTPAIPPGLAPLLDSNHEAVLSGRLVTPPAFDGRRGKILLAADRQCLEDGKLIPLELSVLLTMPFPPPTRLVPGDRLLLRATLRRPPPPGNPGSFDYRRYLADRGILVTGFIRAPAALTTLHETPAARPDRLNNLAYRSQRWRQQVNTFIGQSNLPPEVVGLYQALLTGDRSLLPRATGDEFKSSGTFHLLAISGMHLGLLALLSGLFINLLLRRSTTLLNNFSLRKITAALVLLILCFYAVLAGLQPPVVRALIMAATFIGALLLDRPASPADSLGLAALLTLTWQPASLFQPSLQLSYLAVAGILLFARAFPALFSRPRADSGFRAKILRWLLGGLAVSSAAMVAIAPLTAFHFGQLTLLSPLSTLLVAPGLCFWALPLGLAGVLVSGLSPALGTILLQIGAPGLSTAHALAAALSTFPLTFKQIPPPPLIIFPLYYAFLAGLLLIPVRQRYRLLALPLLLPVLIVLPLCFRGFSRHEDRTVVSFLDVGQGAATLLELADGPSVLVDGGSNAQGAGDFDLGEQVIAPFLRARGLSRLDSLIISHDHADHYNGLSYIVKHFRPRTIWLNSDPGISPGLKRLLALATANGSSLRVPERGQVLLATPTDKLICLSSFHRRPARTGSENSRSLVLELQSWNHRIILPGDIMEEEGEELRQAGLARNYEVLLAPHHGSDNSAALTLARVSRPDWVVVSAGSNAEGEFPGTGLIDWCTANRRHLHRTGVEGAISFSLGPETVTWEKLSDKAGTTDRSGRL